MANNNWNNYTEKTATPVDADEVMVRDSTDGKNKKLLFGTFWKWVAKKLNEATISELQTSNKTIVGALNQLNSDKIQECNVYYGDSGFASFDYSVDACVKDALNNKIPNDSIFIGSFTVNIKYFMLGYKYNDGKYGTLILYDFNNNTARYNLNSGVMTRG